MNRTTPRMMPRACMAAAIAGMALATAQAHAVSITILNNSFETDDVPDNSFLELAPDSWTQGAGASFISDKAVFTSDGIAGAQDGDQYVLAGNSGPSLIHQDTSLDWSSLSVGDTLALSAWTTYRDNDDITTPEVFFWLNDVSEGAQSPLNSGAIDVTDGGQTAAGLWTQRTWEIVVTQADLDFAANNSWGTVNVQIGFAIGGFPSQVAFDNVSLEYTPIPEPTSLALLALGGACMFRRRRG